MSHNKKERTIQTKAKAIMLSSSLSWRLFGRHTSFGLPPRTTSQTNKNNSSGHHQYHDVNEIIHGRHNIGFCYGDNKGGGLGGKHYNYFGLFGKYKTKRITITPQVACHLLVGKYADGGRARFNEMKRRGDMIRSILVDVTNGIICVIGTKDGIKHVERQILMIESIVIDCNGYYPEYTFTSLAVNTNNYSSVTFQRLVQYRQQGGYSNYPVNITPLLVADDENHHREYYTMKEVKVKNEVGSTRPMITDHFNYLNYNYGGDDDGEEQQCYEDRTSVVVDPRYDHIVTDIVNVRLRQFVTKIFMKSPPKRNWNHNVISSCNSTSNNNESNICLSINVNFGKTFLCCVPDELTKHGVTVSMDKLHALPYGNKVGKGSGNGLRPTFLNQLVVDHQTLLSSSLFENDDDDEYEELDLGECIYVDCVSEKTKKRFHMKLEKPSNPVIDDEHSSLASDSIHSAMPSTTTRTSEQVRALQDISNAKTYRRVLDVASTATARQIKIAYQQICHLVHPSKNPDPLAVKAMAILKSARERLLDNSTLCSFDSNNKSAGDGANVPLNSSFVYKVKPNSPRRLPPSLLPEVVEFRSKDNKLALMTILDARSPSNVEFRTTVETEHDEVGMDWSFRRRLQRAWDNRTEDGKFEFPTRHDDESSSGGSKKTSDWLIVDTVRNKKWWKYTNGSYLLTVSETADDYHSGHNTIRGLNISLQSCAITDILEGSSSRNMTHPKGDDSAAKIKLLVVEIDKLHNEAKRIARVINQLSTSV